MKIKILTVFVITNLIFVSSIFSQQIFEDWEPYSQLPVTDKTLQFLNAGQTDRFQYQIAYDNYGLNMITIKIDDQSKLNYYLLDNNGNILEQTLSIDQNIQGATICSYKGKVYIISLKARAFNIYEKINGTNQFSTTPKYSFTPANYYTSLTSDPYINIEAVGLNDHIFFTWDRANYLNGSRMIGFARYSIVNNNGVSFSPIDENMYSAIPTGNGNIVTSEGKLHCVYSSTSHDDCFITRDIIVDGNGNITYENHQSTGLWITGHFDNNIYVALAYSENTNELFLYAQFFHHMLYPNYLYKKKPLVGAWLDNAEVVWDHHTANQYPNENFKKPSVFYNDIINKVGFQFSIFDLDGQNWINNATLRQYDLVLQNLGGRENLFQISGGGTLWEWFRGNSSSSGLKGDYLIYSRFQTNSTEYFKIRRPKPIHSNITNNTLLTGNEYVNKEGLPHAHANGAKIIGLNNSHTRILANTDFYIDAGGSLTLNSGATLELGSNCNLIVENSGSLLDLKPGSNLTIGNGSKIIVRNGGRIIANQINFTSTSSWQGIELTNSGASTINLCTFSNAEKPLSIINDNISYSYTKHHVTSNVINLPSGIYGSGSCFTGRNIFKINFQNNTLIGHSSNTNDRGIFFYNAVSPSWPSEGGEGAGDPFDYTYDLKFVQNEFKFLSIGAMFINSASALAEINFLNNIYTGSKNNMIYGLNAIKTKGNFKNNKFLQTVNDNFYTYGMIFNISNPDLYNNQIISEGATLPLASAHPKMAPYLNTIGQYVWNSGANNLYSNNSDNIKILSASHPLTDWGNNVFTSDHYHFDGYLSDNPQSAATYLYHSRGNCWFPNGSATVNITNPGVTFNYLPVSIACYDSPEIVDIIINDLGDNVYDTLIVSYPINPEILEPDEMYYAQAMHYVESSNYYNASQNLIWLLNECMESEMRFDALYNLFSFYESMDTSSNPGMGFGLWDELYNYLHLKIEQYVEDYEFQDIAYNLSIMCQINMQEYEDAMYKYEGIILEHPDPVQRLIASWDYDALVDLLDTGNYGQGGSIKNLNFENNFLALPGKNFDDLEPVQKSIHQNYRERRIEGNRKSEEKITAMLRDEPSNARNLAEEMRKDGIKREIENRARINMMQSRYLSREDKEMRMIEDLNLITQLMGGNAKVDESISFIPQTYKLEQNYPNPFNPSTVISYQLPAMGLVKLNVYDITGRLIKVLVNEMKEAGSHSITFDGNGLSSGVYFYKLEAGSFTQTKRMVLIK